MKTLRFVALSLFLSTQFLSAGGGPDAASEITYQDSVAQHEAGYQEKEPRWSFGVLYIPYNSGFVYRIQEYSFNPPSIYITGVSENYTTLESQLAVFLNERISLTANIGFTSQYTYSKTETRIRYDDTLIAPLNYGVENKDGIKAVDISMGVKYYILQRLTVKVSPFIFAGLGKRIAFVTNESKELFAPEPDPTPLTDNEEEFLEEINSPLYGNLGFGAEYFFNRSLSIFSTINFSHSRSSGTYEFREIRTSSIRTGTQEEKETSTETRVGFGVNFYF